MKSIKSVTSFKISNGTQLYYLMMPIDEAEKLPKKKKKKSCLLSHGFKMQMNEVGGKRRKTCAGSPYLVMALAQ